MQLRILGSGTIKTPDRKNCSGYLINDEMLLDCGPGIWQALAKSNIANYQIQYLVISHFHTDHISDLAPFLMERYLLPEGTAKKLLFIGPKGLKNWFIKFSEVMGQWLQKLPVEIIEIHNILKLGKYTVKALPTFHTNDSICIRVEDNIGKSIFYSGDSGEEDNLDALAKNCHLGIFEASNTEETRIDGHLTPVTAAKIACNAGVKKLILTHFYPEVYGDDSLEKAASIFDKEIIEAEDGMVIQI